MDDLGQFLYGQFKYGLTVHLRPVPAFIDKFMTDSRIQARGPDLNHQAFGKLAIGVQNRCQNPGCLFGFNSFQAGGAGTITKDYRNISTLG